MSARFKKARNDASLDISIDEIYDRTPGLSRSVISQSVRTSGASYSVAESNVSMAESMAGSESSIEIVKPTPTKIIRKRISMSKDMFNPREKLIKKEKPPAIKEKPIIKPKTTISREQPELKPKTTISREPTILKERATISRETPYTSLIETPPTNVIETPSIPLLRPKRKYKTKRTSTTKGKIAIKDDDLQTPTGTPMALKKTTGITPEFITDTTQNYVLLDRKEYEMIDIGDRIKYINVKGEFVHGGLVVDKQFNSLRDEFFLVVLKYLQDTNRSWQFYYNSAIKIWKRIDCKIELNDINRRIDYNTKKVNAMDRFLQSKYKREYWEFMRENMR